MFKPIKNEIKLKCNKKCNNNSVIKIDWKNHKKENLESYFWTT